MIQTTIIHTYATLDIRIEKKKSHKISISEKKWKKRKKNYKKVNWSMCMLDEWLPSFKQLFQVLKRRYKNSTPGSQQKYIMRNQYNMRKNKTYFFIRLLLQNMSKIWIQTNPQCITTTTMNTKTTNNKINKNKNKQIAITILKKIYWK